MKIMIDPGKVFGRLTVIGDAPPAVCPGGQKRRMILCRCECGNIRTFAYADLSRKDEKRTTSCGCYRAVRNTLTTPPVCTVHGLSTRTKTHYLYSAWKGIKQRCFRRQGENWCLYGGRGIAMHAPWIDNPSVFANYILSELGERPSPAHSLDRIDNNGNYEPGNLRWATKSQQIHNRRSSTEWRPWGSRTGRKRKEAAA